MATHSKASLDQMAQVAARDFIDKGTDLNEGVYKVARAQGLNEEQVGTVCRRANHHVNAAHMKKEAYTAFPVARPEEVMGRMGQEKRAHLGGLLDIPEFEGEEKTASFDAETYAEAGRFENLAAYYGTSLTFTGNKAEDAARFVKAAEIIATRALENGVIHKTAMDQATDDFYGEVRRELLGGRRLDDLVSEMKKNGQYPMLKKVWSRLEADALVPVSHRDDAGPYSLQRMYKQAELADSVKDAVETLLGREVMAADAPILKYAAAYEQARKEFAVDTKAALLCVEGLRRLDKIGGLIEPDERALTLSKEAAGRVMEVAKRLGKFQRLA